MTAKSQGKNKQTESTESFNIQELTKILQSDLTSVDVDTAIEMVDQYQSVLQESNDEELARLANHLKELEKLLKDGKADTAKIAEKLTQLGEETEAFAADLEKEDKKQVQKLSQVLVQAG